MKNKVLIFGEFGQVAKELIKEFRKEDFEVFPLSSKKFNFSDIKSLERTFLEVNPRIVINAAAFNDVEGAERKVETCRKANSLGPKNISIICNKLDLPFIHISTDYVFGDQKRERAGSNKEYIHMHIQIHVHIHIQVHINAQSQ